MAMQLPETALKFLRWFCREDYIEEVEGDLTEVFEKLYETSPTQAQWKFTWSVIRYFRPEFIKSFKRNPTLNHTAMFRHNFLLTYRTFLRYKMSFFINLIGLSTGLACALLIFLWVNNELLVDNFFDKDNQIFQAMQNLHQPNGIETIEATPGLLANALSEEMPEVDYAVSVIPPSFNASNGVISVDDTHIRSTGQYVSKDFFNVFSYKLLYGDKNQVLSEKNGVVISKELAQKLFKSIENAVGKTLDWESQSISGLCFISGVFDSPPANATQQFDLLLNYKWFEESNPVNDWGNSSPRTYVLLKNGTLLTQFSDKIRDFIKSKDSNSTATLFLQQYSERYLYGHYENGIPTGGRIEYVKLFSIIAIFILVIACINFMNLSTAKATRRLKEVGVKKAVGASRNTLVIQYLSESVLMAFLSLFSAVILVLLLLPQFNLITGKQLTLSFDFNLIVSLLSITIITGLIAGSYPALYLSGFDPVAVLKGKLNTSLSEEWVRRGLVVFQFAVSVILIVSVLVVYKQIDYVQTKNLGYNRDHVIYFRTENMSEAFLSELKNIPGVINAGGGNLEAGNPLGGTSGIDWEGKSPDDQTFFSIKWTSYHLIETLGMEIVAGQAFSEDFGSTNQIIFNEEAIERMGLKDPIGKTIQIEGEERQIIGVVKNFHFESFYEEVKPCALLVAPIEYAPKVSVKIQAGTERATIDKIQKAYQAHNPDLVFDYKFMDGDFQNLYASEQKIAVLSKYFAVLAILISCLGLFGLVCFTAERRLKEIGIRKILGSTNFGIVRLLSADFTKMVLTAIVVALPISYFIAKNWLESFAYRIDLQWWFFVGAGVVALLIAWITVGLQTVKAAKVNPVQCLKDE